MISTQTLKGNLINQDYSIAFTLSQGDKGVPFRVELLENGTPYTLLSDDIVTIEWLKPNGNPFLQEGNIKYGTNYIEFTTPEAIAQCNGSGSFNIIISNSDVRKGTIRREYKVVPTSMKPGSVSEDTITDAIAELRELSVEIADIVQNNQDLINRNQVATQGQVNTINTNINDINSSMEEKANITKVNNIQEQINNLVIHGDGNQNLEVVQARTNQKGVQYNTLKNLLDEINSNVKLGDFSNGGFTSEENRFFETDKAIRTNYFYIEEGYFKLKINNGYMYSIYLLDSDKKNIYYSIKDCDFNTTINSKGGYCLVVIWKIDDTQVQVSEKDCFKIIKEGSNEFFLGNVKNNTTFDESGVFVEYTNVICTELMYKEDIKKYKIKILNNSNNYLYTVLCFDDLNKSNPKTSTFETTDLLKFDTDYFMIKIHKRDFSLLTKKTYNDSIEFKKIEISKALNTITVASSQCTKSIKSISDYVCDGINDEIIIQNAINEISINGGTIQLTNGDFYINSIPNIDEGGKACFIFPNNASDITLCGTGIGFSPKGKSGTRFILTENAYNSIGEQEEVTLFRSAYSSYNYHYSSPKFKNFTVELHDNQKKVTVFDMFYSWRMEFKSVAIYGFRVNGITGRPNQLAVEGCTGIRMLDGSNYGFENRLDDVACIGFYEGFKVGGEHIIMTNCSAIYNVYGYTFGNYRWSEGTAFVHTNTLINCCDERNVNLPKFYNSGYCGTTSSSDYAGKQRINLIDFIIERYKEATIGGELGQLATIDNNDMYYGDIVFTMLNPYAGLKNMTDVPFFEVGHGTNFNVKNGAHKLIGDSATRLSYGNCNNFQQYYDTTLNKMLYYINNKWVDGNGIQV